MGALAAIARLVLPPTCAVCRRFSERDDLCDACRSQLIVLRPPLCGVCGVPVPSTTTGPVCEGCRVEPPWFDRARAAFVHEGRDEEGRTLSTLLYRFKYGRDVTIAPILGALLISRAPLPPEHDLIVPVPLHPHRLRWRGFNQAVLLARLLAPRWRVPLDPFVLVRERETPTQVGLTDAARRRNLNGAFRVEAGQLPFGSRVLLVDDVLTTGATVNECARVLREAGASRVDVLAVARAVRRN